jgi:RecB family exonuclease
VNVLQRSLEDADRRLPIARKLLVCRDRSEGRELLRALALRTGGWIGWEPSTVRAVADELALVPLADAGLRVLGDVEVAAVVDQSLDRVLGRAGSDSSAFAPLADGRGFREALADAVLEMRMAAVPPERLRREARDSRTRELAAVCETYARELAARGATDAAGVFEAAITAFDAEWPLLAAAAFLGPCLRTRGLPGRLIRRLLDAGATVLDSDVPRGLGPPAGILVPGPQRLSPPPPEEPGLPEDDLAGRLDLLLEDPPARNVRPASAPDSGPALTPESRGAPPASRPATRDSRSATSLGRIHDRSAAAFDAPPDPTAGVTLFRASSPAAELREVLRRVLAEGRRWDEVEIVASDPTAYGCALDVLAGPPGIPVTYAVGLPLERSRVGRALRAYLRWVEDGFHAQPLLECLMRGEISAPAVEGERPWSSGVARRLRRLGIGWGAARYPAAIAALDAGVGERARRERPEVEPGREESARRETLSARRLLEILVASTPPGLSTEDGASPEARVSPSTLAAAALEFLELVHVRRGSGDEEALTRARERLQEVVAARALETPLPAALADLRAHLRIRIPRPGTVGPLPWSSTAGALHLTDLSRGACTGRPRTFLVGLDSERVSAAAPQDPLLPDALRSSLQDLPATPERLAERQWDVAALLASLRGDVTLSYAAWEAATGSALAPDPVLLQALRAVRGDASLTFGDLETALGPPASPVPAAADRAFDGTDVWLGLLARGPAPAEGEQLVRRMFPGLEAGLRAEAARSGDVLTAFHGWLPGASVLDPSRRAERSLSPSELETAGRCPLSWFYGYALRVRKQEDPEYEPGRWLTHGQRGGLLHRVFERFGRAFPEEAARLTPAADEAIDRLVGEELEEARREVPPPSPIAREIESEEIRRSARLFLEMERRYGGGRWIHVEVSFGEDGMPAPSVPFGDLGPVRVHGRVDRVDRLPSGELRVVDYKTGSSWKYRRDDRFAGGRALQSGLYLRAVEAHLGEPVARFEYRFPTERGEARIVDFTADEAQGAVDRATELLRGLEAGHFLTTDERDDCRFCDHAPICRVDVGEQRIVSPRVEWTRAHRELSPYAGMVRLRRRR